MKKLESGDEFALREDGLYCRQDYDVMKEEALDDDVIDDNHNTDPNSCPVQLAGQFKITVKGAYFCQFMFFFI